MEEKEAAAALVGASAGVYGLCGMCLVDVVEDLVLLVFESYAFVDKEDIDEGKIRTKSAPCSSFENLRMDTSFFRVS